MPWPVNSRWAVLYAQFAPRLPRGKCAILKYVGGLTIATTTVAYELHPRGRRGKPTSDKKRREERGNERYEFSVGGEQGLRRCSYVLTYSVITASGDAHEGDRHHDRQYQLNSAVVQRSSVQIRSPHRSTVYITHRGNWRHCHPLFESEWRQR